MDKQQETIVVLQTTQNSSLAATSTEQLMHCEPQRFPMALNHHCKGLATEDVFRNKYPTLRKLATEYGTDNVKRRVKLLIVWFNELLNLQRGLNPIAIEEIGDKMVDVYPYYNLTMEDLHIALMNGVSGKYSKDGVVLMVNISIVMSWIDKYFDTRSNEAWNYSRNEDGYHPVGVGERVRKERLVDYLKRTRDG
jgi:hypothetical protein